MIWTKGAHQSAKFQTFDCSRKIPPNLYFDRLFLLKVYKTSARKLRRSYVSWHWRVIQNLKKNRFVVSKMTRVDNCLRSWQLPQKGWHHDHNNRGWLKQLQSHFSKANLPKGLPFSLFWCMQCTSISDISSSSENINSTARVSRLSFRFLWLCWNC